MANKKKRKKNPQYIEKKNTLNARTHARAHTKRLYRQIYLRDAPREYGGGGGGLRAGAAHDRVPFRFDFFTTFRHPLVYVLTGPKKNKCRGPYA